MARRVQEKAPGKILSLKVPLTRGKGRAIANFEREFDFNWEL